MSGFESFCRTVQAGALTFVACATLACGEGSDSLELREDSLPSSVPELVRGRAFPTLTPVGRVGLGAKHELKREVKVPTPEQLRARTSAQPVSRPGLVMVDHSDGVVYRVEVTPEEIEDVARNLAPSGSVEPSPRQDPTNTSNQPRAREKGFSNNLDSRERHMYNTSRADAVGAWVPAGGGLSGCTGTLIDDAVVFTAAHCMYNGLGHLYGDEFVAGRDGTGHEPYGRRAAVSHFVDPAFFNNFCHVNLFNPGCAGLDWAIVILQSPPATASGARPSFFGFSWTASDSTYTNYMINHAGYPYLGNAPPANCTGDFRYSHFLRCWVGPFVPNGVYSGVQHSCSVSSGHSGGPIWRTGDYIVGVQSIEFCSGFSCVGISYPNEGPRVTQSLYNQMLFIKNTF